MNKKEIIENLFLRTPLLRPQNLHYNSKRIRNRLSQTPKPLSYPLQPLPEDHNYLIKPLGSLAPLPFHVLSFVFLEEFHL